MSDLASLVTLLRACSSACASLVELDTAVSRFFTLVHAWLSKVIIFPSLVTIDEDLSSVVQDTSSLGHAGLRYCDHGLYNL